MANFLQSSSQSGLQSPFTVVNASTPGKAKSLALSSSLITDGCEFIDLLVYRCKALDSVFPCLPEQCYFLSRKQ
jgi:hypothetical protein